ncbi:S9 family peptidase [Pseudidiomarina gelatinasegens]|uniref:S9 family peptidase n=1 Tax=Pseudidiomarina gelatinasegens TaxID=2487740 RepID=A0A443YZA1_9GAMM|nr:S9 family peptidase [Pseudidiomarina gelatinasegens]RWU09521.1 S9 family peptidase [Pseudidiomarina gelatinasegens]
MAFKNRFQLSGLALTALWLTACGPITPAQNGQTAASNPPVAEQRPYVVESPHGNRQDPYYWLRDDSRTDPEMLAYLEAENAYYDSYRADYAELTAQVEQEIIGRIKQDDSSVPYQKGDYLYSVKYEAGKEYPIHVRTDKDGNDQLMLDVNVLAEGQSYMNVGNLEVSPNQNLMAYMVDNTGRRQYELRIRNLETGEDYAQTLTGLSPAIAWAKDNKTVFVIENDPQTLLSTRVMKYRIGEPAESAELVYEETDNTFYMWVNNTTDGEYIQINLDQTVSTEVHVLDADSPDGEFQVLAPRERDFQYSADHLDDRWIIRTDLNAPNFQIMTVAHSDIGDKSKWTPLIEHRNDVFIQDFTVFTNYLAINERSDGLRRIRIVPWENADQAQFIASDEEAYVTVFERNVQQNTDVLRYTYSSLTTPSTVYAYNMATGEQELLKQTEVPNFDASLYETARTWATANDGTKIPVSLLYKKGFKQDGSAPLYQYAYGSYGSSSDPYFRSTIFSLVDRGFVYAIAHIRGGQEMGRQWYEDGKLLKKINTFTDYIDVTEHLVAEKYAHPDKVFGMGGSAGGLLMGAVANMAPEHYRGLVAHVPFVDVVTTMLDESIPLTTNEFDEWGNPKNQPYYDYMLSYSPYDQVKKQDYPAMLVTTGLHDSQVQYFEPAKWVAKLRTHKTDANPLMYKTIMTAGHGGSSGRFARMKEIAEEYAFILDLVQD